MSKTWTKQPADFNTDLNFGRLAELAFLHAARPSVEPLDGKQGDFALKDGSKLELKTDRYDHAKTQNFFVERYSYGDKPGGPFRALLDGSEYFAYYFENPGFLYLFRTVEFMARVQEVQRNYQLIEIPNRNHVTRGYKMPRSLFADLELKPSQIGLEFDSAKYQEFKTWQKATK